MARGRKGTGRRTTEAGTIATYSETARRMEAPIRENQRRKGADRAKTEVASTGKGSACPKTSGVGRAKGRTGKEEKAVRGNGAMVRAASESGGSRK